MDEFLRQMTAPPVIFRVGQGQQAKEFSLPKDLLCARSKWFNTALMNGRFQEGRTGVIELPEDSPEAFVAFYYWLFNEKLSFADIELQEESAEAYGNQLQRSIEAWIFAEKYALVDMQDCALFACCSLLHFATRRTQSLPASSLQMCFSGTDEKSPLRKIAADFVVTRMDGDREDAASLVIELARFQGFIEALQEAQKFHHVETADTRRRYQRPRHFAHSLGLASEVFTNDETCVDIDYNSSWRVMTQICWDCGFAAFEPRVMCTICKDTQVCQGDCELGVLCEECAASAPTYKD